MYANENTVRGLTKNRVSTLSLAEIEAAASLVDAEIDGRLSAMFWWPNNEQGEPVSPTPAAIVALASQLTAGWIEMQTYAQNEGGGLSANPYGRTLQRLGYDALERIEAGAYLVPGLKRFGPVRTTAAPKIFSPVRGLRGGRGA